METLPHHRHHRPSPPPSPFSFKTSTTTHCIAAFSLSCRSKQLWYTMPSRHLLLSSPSTTSSTLFITIATILTITTLIIIIFFCYLIYRRRSRTNIIPLLTHNSSSVHRFPYNHLLAATNSFSPHNIIGKGASATVYRGVLPTGKSVAVKLIDTTSLSSDSAQIEFQNELRILSRLTSPYVITLLGYCVRKNHRILVFEYMPNRSLQETLFDENGSDLGWDQRFGIVQDVARALAYLHLECDPPIMHGDVKPSNVLLDMDFRARVSDFGISRVKEEQLEEEEEEFGPPLFSQELSGNVAAVAVEETMTTTPAGSSRHFSYNEVDFAQALQASASVKSECMLKDHLVMVEDSIVHEITATCGEDGLSGLPHCVGEDLEEGRGRQWGKDWWWRQDGSREELCSKDYVTEWIGSQIHPRNDNNHCWDNEDIEKSETHRSRTSPVRNDNVHLQMEELGLAKNEGKSRIGRRDKKMHRKLHEWWGEEHSVEISKTRVKLRKLEKKLSKSVKKPILTISRSVKLMRKRKFGEHDGTHYCDPDSDFSFRRGLKKNKEAHSEGSELWSGDLFSRELSSTTSMRGTLCYIAPECGGESGGGCGYLMEKADIYSLGVLILVIVSGRRPLHVLSSPMKLEKANLVSWCRQLAQSGNVLELVDKRLKTQGYSKDQATLCINLALSCLQKMPELRPDIADVVKVLNGEIDLPALPFELSPSPPPKLLSRSRSRQKARGG